MLTRVAMFQGTIQDGKNDAFRTVVTEKLVPLWTRFEGAMEVKLMFSNERDAGVPEYPMILAISYPDRRAFDRAMDCAAAHELRAIMPEILGMFFTGRVEHHTAEGIVFPLIQIQTS
jgi:hypothetical protein